MEKWFGWPLPWTVVIGGDELFGIHLWNLGGDDPGLIVEVIESRFGEVDRVPHRIEWLSDNGAAYTAEQTRTFAASIGLVACTTPKKALNPMGWPNRL